MAVRAPSIFATPVPSSSAIDPEVSTTSMTGSGPVDAEGTGSPGAAATGPGTTTGAAASARTVSNRSNRVTPPPGR
jgi:hypothetical protein